MFKIEHGYGINAVFTIIKRVEPNPEKAALLFAHSAQPDAPYDLLPNVRLLKVLTLQLGQFGVFPSRIESA